MDTCQWTCVSWLGGACMGPVKTGYSTQDTRQSWLCATLGVCSQALHRGLPALLDSSTPVTH
jgi:hypothetical protein